MRLPINAASFPSVGTKLYPLYHLTRGTMDDLNAILAPGMFVKHPLEPDWGTGQVQSNIAGRVTVNFPDHGKVVIDGHRVALVPVFDAP